MMDSSAPRILSFVRVLFVIVRLIAAVLRRMLSLSLLPADAISCCRYRYILPLAPHNITLHIGSVYPMHSPTATFAASFLNFRQDMFFILTPLLLRKRMGPGLASHNSTSGPIISPSW